MPDAEQIDPLYEHLEEAGALLIPEETALHQDIRPARIGLLNLMPAATMEQTETQWLRYMSQTVLQIVPVLTKFEDDPREHCGSSREGILARYRAFDEVAAEGLDGLIVTGDNLELRLNTEAREALPFSEIRYAQQLLEVIGWARSNVHSTIYSCLASHFLLENLYEARRQVTGEKVFGVFDHEVQPGDSALTQGLDDILRAPHSRWGDVDPAAVSAAGLGLLAVSDSAGWLLAEAKNDAGGYDLLIQGHPEYDRHDLAREFKRDQSEGLTEPAGYFRNGEPRLTWANDARALHANWISAIYRKFSGEASSDPSIDP